ncbi:T9SS type A sorting domain-containing protein [Haliscomenobacter sp.]|uniref:T9SS type A sorting domain-containing protein n=1 Tax=Haliscomenobacter sp. TaxID=2717303 RepID=UPI003BA9C38F
MIRLFISVLLTGCYLFASAQTARIINQTESAYLLFEAEAFADNQASGQGQTANWEIKQDGNTKGVTTTADRNFPNLDYNASKLVYHIQVTNSGNYTMYFSRKLSAPTASFVLPRINEAAANNIRRRVTATGGPDSKYVWQNSRRTFFFNANTLYTLVLLPEATRNMTIDKLLFHRDETLEDASLSKAVLKVTEPTNESIKGLLAYNLPEMGQGKPWSLSTSKSTGAKVVDNPANAKGYFPYSGKSFIELERVNGKARLVMEPLNYSTCFMFFGDLALNLKVMSPNEFVSPLDTVKVWAELEGLFSQRVQLAEYTGLNMTYQNIEAKAPNSVAFYNKITYIVEFSGEGDEKLWLDDMSVQFQSTAFNFLIPPADLSIVEDTLILGAPFYTFSIRGNLTDTMVKNSTFFWSFKGLRDTVVKSKDTLRYVFPRTGFYDLTLTLRTRSFIDPSCDSVTTIVSKTIFVPQFDPKKLDPPKPPKDTVVTPPKDTVVTPPKDTVVTPPKDTITNPGDTTIVIGGPGDTVVTNPPDTIVTPPKDTVVTPPKDTVVTPPKDTVVTPPKDTIVTPPVDTIDTGNPDIPLDVAPEGLKVYPNPTTDLLIIQTDNYVKLFYDLTNSRGQSLYKGQFVQQILLSIGSEPTGFYFLRITDAKGNQIGSVQKIVKR